MFLLGNVSLLSVYVVFDLVTNLGISVLLYPSEELVEVCLDGHKVSHDDSRLGFLLARLYSLAGAMAQRRAA